MRLARLRVRHFSDHLVVPRCCGQQRNVDLGDGLPAAGQVKRPTEPEAVDITLSGLPSELVSLSVAKETTSRHLGKALFLVSLAQPWLSCGRFRPSFIRATDENVHFECPHHLSPPSPTLRL